MFPQFSAGLSIVIYICNQSLVILASFQPQLPFTRYEQL